MSAKRRDSLTPDLFADIPRPAPASPASMDFRTQVASLISRMVAAAHANDADLDRYGIAAATSRLAGKEVSKAMLDGYTAESREAFNLPLYLVPALETACNSTLLTDWLAGVRGARLLLGPEALDYEIGRLRTEEQRQARRRRELEDLRRRIR